MRAGLSTIQQTLTPEAASVLNQSIAEAGRRCHGQTTPLHVAATLLASPAGLFRQACVRSHPNSSHPLQCRALELCFSVALDRLPSSANPISAAPQAGSGSSPGGGSSNLAAHEQPPISNALMAALKRAQAHQRRGCPEQQQQPLLAVKVELEQLVVSILDDPSVSRVMREASFSSPAVKATIQQFLVASAPASSPAAPTFSPSPSLDPRPTAAGQFCGLRPSLASPGAPLLPGNRNLYLNPRLQQQQPAAGGSDGLELHHKREGVKRVLDVLLRAKKRNPVVVSDSEPEALLREVLQRIERREVGEGPLCHVEVISLERQLASDRSQILPKLQELGNSIEACFNAGAGGVVLDLGDLRWLVENPGGGLGTGPVPQQQKVVLEMGRAAVAEVAKLLGRFEGGGDGGGRVWLVGTATCATYLRCQVYHPTMEVDWDLKAVPIAPGVPVTGAFPRIGGRGILSSSVESLSIQKGLAPVGAAAVTARWATEKVEEPSRRTMCPACTESYERELAKLVADEVDKSSSPEMKPERRQTLPPWLQVAHLRNGTGKPPATQLQTKEQELKWKQSTEELLKRWTETCSRLHPGFHRAAGGADKPIAPVLPMAGFCNPKLQLARSYSPLQVSSQSNPTASTPLRRPASPPPPGSPVRTDLVLGRAKPTCEDLAEKTHRERLEDSAGCAPDRFSGDVDIDSFKQLLKGLTEKVTWQPEAASLVAATVLQCKSGGGKRRCAGSRGDAWLLFLGPDRVGKRKMAAALSELVAGGGVAPVTVSFGDPQADARTRGKTALDRVVEAVRRNPFSVVVLEDMDRADVLVHGSLKRAMERGRLPDSHGREVALGSAIFVMISGSVSPENPMEQCEEKLSAAASSGWQLELAVGAGSGKRRADWVCREGGRKKTAVAPPGLSLDLNLAVTSDEGAADGSPNSSDLTVEHEGGGEGGRLAAVATFPWAPRPAVHDLIGAVDEAVVFKPVDFGELRRKVSDVMARRFRSVVGDGRSLSIDGEALDRVVGGVWFGAGAAFAGLEEWAERVLVPAFQQLRSRVAPGCGTVVRLLPVKDGSAPRGGAGAGTGEWLPTEVTVDDVDGT